MNRYLIAAIFLVSLLGAFACDSKKKDEAPTVSPASPAGTISPSPPAGSPGATIGASTGAAAATQTNAELALAALTELIGRANSNRCPPGQNPATCSVLSIDTNISTDFDHGLGAYHVKDTAGPDVTIVVGRTVDGQWQQYLWGNPLYHVPPTYQREMLPAAVTICAFASSAKVYASSNPNSGEVGELEDGTVVNAEQFVLTQPGTIGNAAVNIQGYGWYRVAEPAGWVYSKYVAAGPGCELHDALERP